MDEVEEGEGPRAAIARAEARAAARYMPEGRMRRPWRWRWRWHWELRMEPRPEPRPEPRRARVPGMAYCVFVSCWLWRSGYGRRREGGGREGKWGVEGALIIGRGKGEGGRAKQIHGPPPRRRGGEGRWRPARLETGRAGKGREGGVRPLTSLSLSLWGPNANKKLENDHTPCCRRIFGYSTIPINFFPIEHSIFESFFFPDEAK